MKVLYLGGDERTQDMLAAALRAYWQEVSVTEAFVGQGLRVAVRENPDLLVVQADSCRNFLAVVQEVRKFSATPLIVLAVAHEGDEAIASEALLRGADDYIRFSPDISDRLSCGTTELLARVVALQRRADAMAFDELDEGPIHSGGLVLNPSTYEVFLKGRKIQLSSTEFRLLHLLMKSRGVVFHETLQRAFWGELDDGYGLAKKYIQRLRRKLNDDAHDPTWIVSIHGVGYRFIGSKDEVGAAEDVYLTRVAELG